MDGRPDQAENCCYSFCGGSDILRHYEGNLLSLDFTRQKHISTGEIYRAGPNAWMGKGQFAWTTLFEVVADEGFVRWTGKDGAA